MTFPVQHCTKLLSANPLEHFPRMDCRQSIVHCPARHVYMPERGQRNKEVKRRADLVGVIPNEGNILRLIGTVLFQAKRRLPGPESIHTDQGVRLHRHYKVRPVSQHISTSRQTDALDLRYPNSYQLGGCYPLSPQFIAPGNKRADSSGFCVRYALQIANLAKVGG